MLIVDVWSVSYPSYEINNEISNDEINEEINDEINNEINDIQRAMAAEAEASREARAKVL